ncbi:MULTISPECIES: hypothetical protein [unclassified Arthrobacter]|uniref:hypothetical protein n=1 Tax=unclassified Arthrobacter TaxID=235627 RepID=UPI001CFFD070|nr:MULTISPECIES: hypothetical protein [unclassified Arthrobacter]MCB5282588.1 hypothetical protein [Arthrobacter sp. ES1]WGZ79257.1 hypothetical protein QI450_15630 [Arthrobacter sp. EM1]
MTKGAIRVRAATVDDKSILAAAAFQAMNGNGTARFTQEGFKTNPSLSRYLAGWPQVGDFGVVAETDDGTPIGSMVSELHP